MRGILLMHSNSYDKWHAFTSFLSFEDKVCGELYTLCFKEIDARLRVLCLFLKAYFLWKWNSRMFGFKVKDFI